MPSGFFTGRSALPAPRPVCRYVYHEDNPAARQHQEHAAKGGATARAAARMDALSGLVAFRLGSGRIAEVAPPFVERILG